MDTENTVTCDHCGACETVSEQERTIWFYEINFDGDIGRPCLCQVCKDKIYEIAGL